jgi:hypothetical protein
VIALLLAGTAHAQDGLELTTDGELREIVSSGSDFAVDADGTTLGQGLHVDQRLRVAGFAKGAKWRYGTEWDLGVGQLAGDTWDIPGDGDERHREIRGALTPDAFQPRQLWMGLRTGKLDLQWGLQTSHWGLGLLANDGDHEPIFGREDFGDRVLRVKATTAPFAGADGKPAPTYVVVAADVVYADELARLVDGQVAAQAVAAVLHDEGPDAPKRGVYAVFRNQYERGFDRVTRAGALDGFVAQPVALSDTLRLDLAAEAVGLLGRTNRAVTYEGRDGLAVLQGGAAAETRLHHELGDLRLNAGWTSGDGLPDDAGAHEFLADRDYNVGLVLFDEVLGAIDAQTHHLLSDPKYAGQAPDGVELVATEGAINGAAWVQPALAVRPHPRVELRTGAVFAWSTAPIAQPFYSFRAGGIPTNHLDQPTSGSTLGTELDWAVAFKPPGGWKVRPRLEVQGGHAMLGEALGGGTVHLVQGAFRAEW